MKRITMLFGAGILILSSMIYAAVPQLINFQAILRNGSGSPVTNGSYFVTFRIYNVPSGGTAVWSDTQTVTTNSGLFNAVLGRGTPVPDTVFNDSVRYLGIQVFPDAEMTPRQRLTTAGYSFRSEEWSSSGQDLFRLNGRVGIGTANPQAKLHVSGNAEGLRIQGNGVGAPGGAYVSFYDSAGTGIGYVGDGSSGDQDMYVTSYVGRVHLYTPVGAALTATSTGNVGIGTTTPEWRLHVVESAFPYASYLQNLRASGSATGVIGTATAFGGLSHTGVFGDASGGNNNYGVFGQAAGGTSYAGYFTGNVHVTGTLTKGSGAFKIDHPTDPANKYLYHSFVESPDMMNIYNGNVVTDAKGNATVTLPDWFGALNKDFRYQLTVIGQFAQAIISKKIENNRFSIQTDKPKVEVSWQVTGIRQDAYANAHRIPVEELKSDKERGYYLHPDLFGQPEEKQMDWAHDPEMMKEMKARRLQAEKEKK